MKLNKIFLVISIIVFSIVLFACKKDIKFGREYYINTASNKNPEYRLIYSKTSTILNKNFNASEIDKLYKEETTLFLKNTSYVRNESKDQKNRVNSNVCYKYYFDFKEFSIKLDNEEKKMEYLSILDLKESYYIDNLSKVIYKDKITITKDLDLVKVSNFNFINKITENFNEINNFISNTFFDNELKSPEAYFKGDTYISKANYDNLKASFDEVVDQIRATSFNEENFNNAYAKLLVNYKNAKDSIVKGAKEYLEGDINNLKKDYNIAKENLESKHTNLLKVLNSLTIINNKEEQNNYYLDNNLIEKSNYLDLFTLLNKAKSKLVLSSFSDDNLNQVSKDIKELNNLAEELGNKYANINTFILKGSKTYLKRDYKVEIYHNDILKETLTLSGDVSTNIVYKPEVFNEFDIDPKSNLEGYLGSDNNLLLRVYYKQKKLVIPLDLDGGKISSLDKNYLELNYGEKLSNELYNKIKTVVKNNDKIGNNYQFNKLVNAYTGDEITPDYEFRSEIILKVLYTFSTISFNYQIEYYLDDANSDPKKPLYSTTPEKTITSPNSVNTGDHIVFDLNDIDDEYKENLSRGNYLIDYEESIIQHSKIAKDAKFKIYLKRKKIGLTINYSEDLSILGLINNRKVVKYGAYLSILPERYLQKINDNDYSIFNKLVNAKDNSEYELGSKIYEDTELNFISEVVNKTDLASIGYYKNYQGKLHNREQTIEYLFIKKNTKIKDPIFFKNINYSHLASFNLDENIGYLKNNNTGDAVGINDIYTENTTLEFVYRLNYQQLVDLYNLKIKKLDIDHLAKIDELKDKVMEVKAKINGITKDNKYYILELNGNYMLLDYSSIKDSERHKLSNNNLVSLAGTLSWGAQEYFTSDNNKAGRYYSFVMVADPKTPINLISEATDHIITPKDLNNVKENYLGFTNINNLSILSNAGEPEKIEELNTNGYYQVLASDEMGNLTYLLLNENNNSSKKLFKELRKGNIINLKNTLYLPFRVKRINKQDFVNSGTKHYNAFLIEDFANEVEVQNTEISVNYQLVFPEYENWTKINNVNGTIKLPYNSQVSVLDSLISDTFYNGYELDNITRNGEVITKTDTILAGDTITFNFKKDEKVITFYYASYIKPEEMELYSTFIRDGKEYVNKPVDYDDKVYKFIFSYDFGIRYLEFKLKYGSDLNSIDLVIGLSQKDNKQSRTYCAFEATKYSLIAHRFGTTETQRFSYQWGDILPYELTETEGKLNKGMFVHAFTTSLGAEDQDKYANASLYSCIQIESKGLVNADADYHINKDHNMPSRYTNYDGSLFFQFHGNKSDDEIINNPKYEIKAHMGMTLKDKDNNGNIYDTNENRKYYFHKSSLSKYAKFNKFGISILALDLTPYVDGKLIADCSSSGKLYKSDLSIEEQKEMKLSKTDERIIPSDNFFNYLKLNNLPILDNYFKIKREYKEYEFILPSGYTFSNNESQFKYLARENQTLDQELLKVNNLLPNEEILFYDPIKEELIDFKYKFNGDTPTKIELVIAKKRSVSITAYSKDNQISKLYYKVGFNIYEINASEVVDKNARVYQLDILENNNYPNLFNNFYFGLDENDKNNAINFQIAFSDNNSNYLVFEGSSNVLPYQKDTNKFLLGLIKSNNLDNFEDAKLKITYQDGSVSEELITNYLYQKQNKELAYFFIETQKNIIDAKLYKGSNLANTRNLKNYFKKEITLNLIDFSENTRPKDSNAIFNNFDYIEYKELVINPLGVSEDILKSKTINLPKAINNYQKELKSYIPELDGYELTCYYEGSIISRNDLFSITNQKQVITLFYKPIYRPGEYNKVYLDLGQDQNGYTNEPIGAVSGEITKYLLNNYFYSKVGQNLSLLASATITINPKWHNTKTFIGWEDSEGNLVDLNEVITNGNQDIYLKARYNELNTNSIIYYEEYLENSSSQGNYTLIKKDQLSVANPNFTFNEDDISIPNGYTIDMAKSILTLNNMPSLSQTQRIIKIYFKANEKEMTFNLNGGEIEESPAFNTYLAKHNMVYNKLTGEITFKLLYGRDLNSVLSHLLTLYLPKKAGKEPSKIKLEYFGNSSLNKELSITEFLANNLSVLDHNMSFTFIYE